jgi:hypothetical protein
MPPILCVHGHPDGRLRAACGRVHRPKHAWGRCIHARTPDTHAHAHARARAGIEEVNIFKDDDVIHFTNPKVQASIAANTYVISGPSQTKKLQELLPGILNQVRGEAVANAPLRSHVHSLAKPTSSAVLGGALRFRV